MDRSNPPSFTRLHAESGYPASDGGAVHSGDDSSDYDRDYDVVVVGAGLTGLVTALLFARAGRTVAVLEARHIGAGTTGHTTAKASLLQGSRLSQLSRRHSAETVRAYVEANREGQQWLLRYCGDHDVPVQLRPAYTYAVTGSGERTARAELDACRTAGLDAVWSDTAELPFETRGAVRLNDQVQFDPLDVLSALLADLQEHGGRVFEGTRVRTVRTGDRCTVVTDYGPVHAEHVVLATGIPVLDRGGFFARLEPHRSYAMAFRTAEPSVTGMYLSADSPTRSLRSAPTQDDELLLVGGNGHTVGRQSPTSTQVDDLVGWTLRHFPGAELTHSWSAQDYEPVDGLPYVGPLTPGNDRVLIATGYDKWGMTNAVAAGLALSARVLGGSMPWAAALDSWRLGELTGLPGAARLNGGVAIQLAAGWLRAATTVGESALPSEGQGRVERLGTRPVATCTVGGTTYRTSAVCPHLGGILRWNDAESSWDCPLHGSRFAADGELLEGPATRGLDRIAP
ncbi:MAG: FAD dependent oxidoreductase [uncultured Nocardioidaceae bacterium]|uniref:FAD dependent oxidoreductase n=1 Tax=uncultured Nocardioidaceae bacterium TaxID=253824 RepID=A0A6J4MVJ8_9ACTN|nr:MAG: FAD dependent oxidoreductase [uncultured Nocardioidaceae bacterium]